MYQAFMCNYQLEPGFYTECSCMIAGRMNYTVFPAGGFGSNKAWKIDDSK